ncbi:MAG: translation elongation factor Ts [Candidatus Muproteobacteria bacterium RBG_16_65_34]|uniref:Elongation factor Ts n=1 Tax=Candidatus Muproteobacteria bacterium RBG_16_65_34 TaxID=1817760 RepID=A0A1F6TMV0_9PROT|nr:MAG: translation elongation factor Ts [Candidatus Muproteobacteria bacterium RBG_16_65_34]
MSVSAQQVKELRERTGLGMMECKTALTETHGDMEAAAELLRKRAGAKVEKKAGRIAADGGIGLYLSPDRKLAAVAEVNSETDFVAKGEDFMGFANAVAARAAAANPADLDALMNLPLTDGAGASVARAREALVMKLGENIGVRRFERYAAGGRIGAYVHGRKIGVLVELEGGDEGLARDLAMHIAASKPEYVSRAEVPAAQIEKEKAIFAEQAKVSGKPAEIIEKMVLGRVNKYLNEIALLGQPFVKDPDTTVEKLLKSADAKVVRFVRYEVGEGIEKRAGDFAAEVMAQVRGG